MTDLKISKRDAFSMTPQQVAAGREVWRKTSQQGRLVGHSSFDARDQAPKTWILWATPKGEEICTIECEIYMVGRVSDSREAVAMVHGTCPKCKNDFLAREDNKSLHIEWVSYRKAPAFAKVNWAWHCENVLHKRVSDSDKIPIVSSPERWACDYCKGWCVKVIDGIAKTDMTGVTQVVVSQRAASTIIGGGEPSSNKVEL